MHSKQKCSHAENMARYPCTICGFKVNIFCLLKIRFRLSTETFDIQRALNIQSFTLISFCYPLPLTNLNLLPFYELLYTPSLIYNRFLVEFNVECTPFMSYLNLTSDFQVKFTNYLAIKLTSKASDKNLIFLRQFSVFKSLQKTKILYKGARSHLYSYKPPILLYEQRPHLWITFDQIFHGC